MNGTRNDLLEKIVREEKLSTASRLQVENVWRKILRAEKLESLKEDLTTLKERHDTELTRKDEIISTFLNSFEYAEGQFRISLASHLKTVDELVHLHERNLVSIKEEFVQEVDSLRCEYSSERETLVKTHELETKNIQEEITAIQNREQFEKNSDKRNHNQNLEEIREQ